jgi:integrase
LVIPATPETRKPARPAKPHSKLALAYPQKNPEARPSETKAPLLDVKETASILRVSESWVRRHVSELPAFRVGRLVRFDRPSLLRQFQVKFPSGNRMKQKGEDLMFQAAIKTRYQSGRVYKKGKVVKKWYGQFREDQIDAEGKIFRVQKNVCLGTLGELPTKQAAMRELTKRMGTGTPRKADMLFSDLVSRWRAAVVPTLRSTTATHYHYALSSYIVPTFGQREIKSITRFDVELFLAEKAKTYSRNTLHSMRVALSRVLSWAVNAGWLDKNPCAGVQLPQAPTKVQRTILTSEQVMALASKLEEPYATLVLFLAATGLRISEGVGVKVEDFEGNVLRLRHRFYQGNSGGDYGELKTKKSARNLPLPAWLADRVRSLADGKGFCFRSQAGTPLNQKNGLRRYIHPACAELGFRIGGWHDLRHTVTTWALKKYPTKVVSEMLGHANARTTLDVYSHVMQEDFAEPLAEMAGKLLHDVAQNGGNQIAG